MTGPCCVDGVSRDANGERYCCDCAVGRDRFRRDLVQDAQRCGLVLESMGHDPGDEDRSC